MPGLGKFKKHFTSEFDNPPAFQKFYSYLAFGFIIIMQYVCNLVYFVLPRSIYLRKIVQNLQIRSLEIIKQHGCEDEFQPLRNFKRSTPEESLAGFKHEMNPQHYKSALTSFSSLYNLAAYSRFKSCFHREIMSVPSDVVEVRLADGNKEKVINTCSYNYLGLSTHNFNHQALIDCTQQYGIGCFINRREQDLEVFQQLESAMCSFLHTEACVVHGMGYDTNAMTIPCLIEDNTLLISDQFNHNSIVRGCMYSNVEIQRFNHHNMSTLEAILINNEKITQHKNVIIIVEGLYSMEGEYVDLPYLIQLKKKYNFKLFVDEAHSIGAVGKNGGGVRDYYNAAFDDIDFYMGTFTKSFSSSGGYVAGNKCYIDKIRKNSIFYNQQVGLCPAFAMQILQSLKCLQTPDGLLQIARLRDNSLYFRQQLKLLKFTVYGSDDSPVIPVLFYNPAKMKYISEELLRRKIAVVVVGFPAVPLVSARIRFCISAAHTREEMDYILAHLDQLGSYLRIKFEK